MLNSLRAVLSIALSLVVSFGVAHAANDATLVFEDIIKLDEGSAPSHAYKVRIDDLVNIEFNGKEKLGFGPHIKLEHGWAKLFVDTIDFKKIDGIRVQNLTLGSIGKQTAYGFGSLRIAANSGVTQFTEGGVELAQLAPKTSFHLIGERFGPLNDWSLDQFRVGGELQQKLKGVTLKGRCTFGSGDPQFQLWIVTPIGGSK